MLLFLHMFFYPHACRAENKLFIQNLQKITECNVRKLLNLRPIPLLNLKKWEHSSYSMIHSVLIVWSKRHCQLLVYKLSLWWKPEVHFFLQLFDQISQGVWSPCLCTRRHWYLDLSNTDAKTKEKKKTDDKLKKINLNFTSPQTKNYDARE